MNKDTKVFYIDPMSYNNLALYDYSLLNNHNCECEIYFYGNINYDYKDINGVKFKRIFCYSNKKGLFKVSSYIFSIIKILFDVIVMKPEIVHIQWIRIPIVDILFNALIKILNSKTKLLYTAHNVFPHNSNSNIEKLYLKYYSSLDSIITHSKQSKQRLVKELKINKYIINVIPHGLLDYRIDENIIEDVKSDFIKSYNLYDKIIVTSLGIQSRYKGSDKIVEFIENSDNLDVVFIIAGKNDKVDMSVIRDKDNVIILDRYVSDAEFVSLLKISHLTLLPYREISQSGVLLSAINESCPFIVSDAGSLAEPLNYGDVGWSFKANDFAAFIITLNNILDKPDFLYSVKSNKKEWEKVQEIYSWEQIQIKTINLYHKLLKN